MSWQLNQNDLALIDLSLEEDMGKPYTDATTSVLFKNDARPHKVKIISKEPEPIIFAGHLVLDALMGRLTKDYKVNTLIADSEVVSQYETICEIESDANSLLMAERTILNFMRHLCAVATMTNQFVKAVEGTGLKILDTRKTMPGMRHLEKYAVHCGGGVNHRMGLYDAIMIKDTHVDLLGGMKNAIDALPDVSEIPVIVEIRTKEDLEIVLAQVSKVNRVLLDNMTPEQMKECVAMCQGSVDTEASGNLSLDVIRAVAECGVDYASVGAITHSAGNVDLSMRACL